MSAYTYIVRCEGGSLYTGIARDVRRRMETHLSCAAASAKYTKSHRVFAIAALWRAVDYSAAARLEYAIKRLKKSEKEDIILHPERLFGDYLAHFASEDYRYIADVSLDSILQKETETVDFWDREEAPAKLNLYLDVVGKREDGFHDIHSVMTVLSLSDTVTLTATDAPETSITLSVAGTSLPTDGQNLSYRAVAEYLSAAHITANVTVKLEKRIPVSAGLGGGSADAAATLRLMQKAFHALPKDALYEIAARIGSDVPFCLCGGAALCLGRGERITPVTLSAEIPVVVVKSDESVSTPMAYRRLDALYNDFKSGEREETARCDALIMAMQRGDASEIFPLLYNIFEDVSLPECPKASAFCDTLRKNGAARVLMAGSGPTVIGFFDSMKAAKKAARMLGDVATVASVMPYTT